MTRRYQISERIGEGGEVFLAHDSSLDRRVALRFLPENLRYEAKAAAALDHPYICKIYEIGEDEGKPFIAMEYIRGETLEQRLARGALPLADAVRIASEIAEALETAHQQGLVHRDLRPSNIMLTDDGHVKVMGFGLAKPTATPDNDPRSDILSFGIVLQEMLRESGTVPDFLPIIEKMLEKTPEKRYQSVRDVRLDLARLQAKRAAGRKSNRWVAAVAVLTLLLFGGWLIDSLIPQEPPSIAVLPLRNISDEPVDSDYIAEGISQAVITRLVQAGLRVTPWDTVRRYGHTGEPAEEIARQLNADTVLIGTFDLAGDRILASLSLVDAESGLLSWAEQFETPYEDIFQMQQQIAVRAATSLKRTLTGEEEEVLAAPESQSVDAYDFYLQGAHTMQEGGEEATNIAFEYFNRAVELDPNLAEAHVGLGAVQTDRYLYGWGGRKELEEARASFERAIQLKPTAMRARTGLCFVSLWAGQNEECLVQATEAGRFGQADDAETILMRARGYAFGGLPERAPALYRRALELDPVNEEAHAFLTIVVWGTPEAIDVGNRYVRLFGDYHQVHNFVAFTHQILGNDELAREHYEKAMADANPESLVFGGLLFDRLGNTRRAHQAWRQGIELVEPQLEAFPDNAHLRLYLACFYGLLGDRAAMLAEEEQALENSFAPAILAAATVHASLGETNRAAELLRRSQEAGMNLPYWTRYLQLAIPDLEFDEFDQLLADYEAEVQRLEEAY